MKNLVALIDSNAVAARGLQLSLEDGGHQVILGADGPEILRKLPATAELSLVLAEQWSSGEHGGLAEALHVRGQTKGQLPIIVLASRFDNHDSLTASVPDLTIVLTPTEPADILATVARVLAKAPVAQPSR